jgi:hypothetical protein
MSHLLSSEPDSSINPSKIVWWLLSTITAVLLVAGAAWGSALASHQQVLDDREVAISAQQELLDRRLSVIEGKLDILLERSSFAANSSQKRP